MIWLGGKDQVPAAHCPRRPVKVAIGFVVCLVGRVARVERVRLVQNVAEEGLFLKFGAGATGEEVEVVLRAVFRFYFKLSIYVPKSS